MTGTFESWGRYPKATPASVRELHDRHAPLPASSRPMLVYGNGRSYGDVCLNDGGDIILGRGLDRFITFNTETGVLRAEAGVLLSEILELVVPRSWFLPVTPGTRFVTLGGAVANDVHGKNHHKAGTFGCHVRALELVRSDGSRRICSPTECPDWFAATIGGLGLTGLITWVEIQLRKVEGVWIEAESLRFPDLENFFTLSEESDQTFEHTAAWLDCTGRGKALGRGVFLRGNHAPEASGSPTRKHHGVFKVPCTPPASLINKTTIRIFNGARYRKPVGKYLCHYEPFFYPLDTIERWNLMYGPRGFLQYQCVLPTPAARDALRECLARISAAGKAAFLAVLKIFGERNSPGLLSFPRPGITVALDFPFCGQDTLTLLNALDTVVMQAGGALYPAKDARMSATTFRASFPRLDQFTAFVDAGFSSGFWRRLMRNV